MYYLVWAAMFDIHCIIYTNCMPGTVGNYSRKFGQNVCKMLPKWDFVVLPAHWDNLDYPKDAD